MSLCDDFGMYYNNTYVGYMHRGKVLPFFVTSVSRGRNFEDNDYSEQAVENLIYRGHVLHPDGEFRDGMGSVAEGKIVLDMQELGYVTVPGRPPVWLSWKPQRSTKKGLCHRRVDGVRGDINRRMAQGVFDMWGNTNIVERQFAVDGEELLYKGRSIGTKIGDTFTVRPQYQYLRGTILKGFGNQSVFEVMEEGVDA